MILMGDEMRRSQCGNNNAYCQDNEISWLDWALLEKHADVHHFVQLLIRRRLLRDEDAERQRKPLNQLVQEAIKSWHGVKLNQADWSDDSHRLALSVEVEKENLLFYMILNAHWDPHDFELPAVDRASQGSWRRWIDTSLEMPDDIVEWQNAAPIPTGSYRAGARSTVVLIAGGIPTASHATVSSATSVNAAHPAGRIGFDAQPIVDAVAATLGYFPKRMRVLLEPDHG
jgi:glycogen operon protein